MAAEIELPEHVFVHGYLLLEGEKMSKSLGNVLDPFEVIERFGSDALRFYLLRDVPFGQDGSVSTASFELRYETELANELGNLANRAISMLLRYRDGEVARDSAGPGAAERLRRPRRARRGADRPRRAHAALDEVWQRVRRLNRYVEERAPWQLAKDPDAADELDLVLRDARRRAARAGGAAVAISAGEHRAVARGPRRERHVARDRRARGPRRVAGVSRVNALEALFPKDAPAAAAP